MPARAVPVGDAIPGENWTDDDVLTQDWSPKSSLKDAPATLSWHAPRTGEEKQEYENRQLINNRQNSNRFNLTPITISFLFQIN
jgi:hypothetical protein